MKRWALFVGLAACAAVAAGCGKEAVAPDPTWAAVSAECQEAMESYPGFTKPALVAHVHGDCESFEFQPLDKPREWQQFKEEVFVMNPGQEFPTRPTVDFEKVTKEPPDQKPIAEFLEYDKWRDPKLGDLDYHGRTLLRSELLAMRYLPLYRWGCQEPDAPEVELTCKLTLEVSTRVEQSIETSSKLGISFGVGNMSSGTGGGIQGELATAEKQTRSTFLKDAYSAEVMHTKERNREDNLWFIAQIQDYRTNLVRDVYQCKKYQQIAIGLVRYTQFCQLWGIQYQTIDVVEFVDIAVMSVDDLKSQIHKQHPDTAITGQAEELLDLLESAYQGDSTPPNAPMNKLITFKINGRSPTHTVGIEFGASWLSKSGLTVTLGGGVEKTVGLVASAGLTVATETKVSSQEIHRLDFDARGPDSSLLNLRYRTTYLRTGDVAGSYYVIADY